MGMYHTFGVCNDPFDIAIVAWARGRQQEAPPLSKLWLIDKI